MIKINAQNYVHPLRFNQKPVKSGNLNTAKKENKPCEIGVKEGAMLVMGGAKDKVKNIALSFVKHPILSIASISLTSAFISLSPLIGLSSAAATGAIGLIYGGYSLYTMGKNIKNAVKDKKEGNEEKFKKDLREIGSTGVDVALSLNKKVLKRNLKAVKYQAKYGKIGLRPGYIRALSKFKGVKQKRQALMRLNEIVTKDINIPAGIDELQKQLRFSNEVKKEYFKLFEIQDNEDFLMAAYNRLTTDLKYKNGRDNFAPRLVFDYFEKGTSKAYYNHNGNCITLDMKNWPKGTFSKYEKAHSLAILRHELQHFQQVVDIERTEGLGGVEALHLTIDNKKRKHFLEHEAPKIGFDRENPLIKLIMDKDTTFFRLQREIFKDGKIYNTDDYLLYALTKEDRVDFSREIKGLAEKQGKIKRGTKEAKKAAKFFDSFVHYTNVQKSLKDGKNFIERFKLFKDFVKYTVNPVELDAERKAGVFEPLEEMASVSKMLNFRAILGFLPFKKDED